MIGKGAIWLTSSIMAVALSGCQSADRRLFQGDPLLAYKKPLTSLPKADEKSVLLTYAEPKPPDMPEAALLADAHRKDAEKGTAVAQTAPNKPAAEELRALMPAPSAKARLEVFLTSRRK